MAIEAGVGFVSAPKSRQKIVVVGNEKGGTGKSTTALHLAVTALYRGHNVGTLDLDSRQATLSRYLHHRQQYAERSAAIRQPQRLRLDEPTGAGPQDLDDAARQAVADALDHLADCDVIVIDTPGSPTALSRAGHERADILVTPVNDSLLDIDVLAEIDPVNRKILRPCHYCQMAWEHGNQRIADGLSPIDWVVIRNRLPHIHSRNRQDIEQILQKLAHRIGFRLAPGLSERVIFRELFLNGLTVLDLEAATGAANLSSTQHTAAEEVGALFHALHIAPDNAEAMAR